MEFKLSDAKKGTTVEVVKFEGEENYEFKFISLGILPGDIISIQSRSLFGGPICIKHGERNFFALRKSYASKVIVRSL
jgi:Fe2+ transport system protein FeoA